MSLQFTLVRHGKADKTSSPNHRVHNLSEVGQTQAKERREKLGNPQFDLILHSILPRTKQTAQLVAGVNGDSKTIEIPGLFYEDGDPRGVALDQAFDKLGYAPLGDYLRLQEVNVHISSLAAESLGRIMIEIEKANASNVLIVGHAVLLQALGHAMTGKDLPFTVCQVGECEGFKIVWNNTIEHRTESIEVLD